MLEKEKYEVPVVEIIEIETKDSIAVSGESRDGTGLWESIWWLYEKNTFIKFVYINGFYIIC